MQRLASIRRFGGKLAETAGLRSSAQGVIAKGQALAAQGLFREAIEFGTVQNRRLHDPALERQLVLWRHQGYVALKHPPGRPDWPPAFADPFPDAVEPPEIRTPDALTAERMGGAMLHHGCVIVRGLLARDEVERLKAGIDQAQAAFAAAQQGSATPQSEIWYSPLPLPGNEKLANSRHFAQSGGGVWTADSPRMLFEWIEIVKAKGIDTVIGGYFGEQPALSLSKSTLRRVPATARAGDWHQDGAFLGGTIRTVNLWLSLSDCGMDAPGLDMVKRRLPEVVETGTHGASFDWTVGPGLIETLAAGRPTQSPIFAPGDAVFFDQLFLHRTGVRPGMTKERYAIESWFFAPSTYPTYWEPLLV